MPSMPADDFDAMMTVCPDEPLPSLGKFDRFSSEPAAVIRQACEWVEQQRTCSIIAKHHGRAGLQRVLRGIAKAASARRVPMTGRVRSVAEFYGLEVY